MLFLTGKNWSKKATIGFIGLFLFLYSTTPKGVAAGEKSLLWAVRSESGIVYLLGSIHVATKDLYPLKKSIEDAYRQSDSLVVEVNVDAVSPEKTQALMLERGTYKGGKTLGSELSNEIYTEVDAKLRKSGMAIELFLKFKPWFVALTLTSLEIQRLGFLPRYGIDRHFLDSAKGKKPVLQLESFEEQIATLDALSDQDQEAFLFYTIKDLNTLGEQMEILMQAWANGDSEAIDTLLREGFADRPDLVSVYKRFNIERNRKMLSKIEGYLRTDRQYFVVVGAGHLVGKEGLVMLLREKGYAVQQL